VIERKLERIPLVVADHGGRPAESLYEADLGGILRRGRRRRERRRKTQSN